MDDRLRERQNSMNDSLQSMAEMLSQPIEDPFDQEPVGQLGEDDDELEMSPRRRRRRRNSVDEDMEIDISEVSESPRRRREVSEYEEVPRRPGRRVEEPEDEYEEVPRRPRRRIEEPDDEYEETPRSPRPRVQEPEDDYEETPRRPGPSVGPGRPSRGERIDGNMDLEDEDEDDNSSNPRSLDSPVANKRRPIMDDDDDEDDEEVVKGKSKLPGFLKNIKIQPKYIAIIVGLIAFFIVGNILDDGSDTTGSDLNAVTGVSSSEEEVQESETGGQTGYDSVGEPIERGYVDNSTQMEYSKDVYTEELTITKFIEYRGASAIPKFMAHSDILNNDIEFVVSPQTYNKFMNGARITVEYRSVIVNDYTYVTDIKIR